jgi:hypothetical protein
MEDISAARELNALNARYFADMPLLAPPSGHAERSNDGRTFPLFSSLPPEIRTRVWEASLAPRIVRWIRKNEGGVFTAPPRSLPLMSVCRESRAAAFLYGKYRVLTDSSKVYFSPLIDYLWFDPMWTTLGSWRTFPQDDPLESIRPQLGELRNVMVHPNWSGERKDPMVSFARLPLKRVLVAADEKSIGLQSQVMLDTMQDIMYYYLAFRRENPGTKIPYIAVGCLGWTGNEPRYLRHGNNRQLLKVFENHAEMKAHLAYIREEEWKFTQERFVRPKIAHNLRWVRNGERPVNGIGESTRTRSVDSKPYGTNVGTEDTKSRTRVAGEGENPVAYDMSHGTAQTSMRVESERREEDTAPCPCGTSLGTDGTDAMVRGKGNEDDTAKTTSRHFGKGLSHAWLFFKHWCRRAFHGRRSK